MGRHVAGEAPDMDRLVADSIREILLQVKTVDRTDPGAVEKLLEEGKIRLENQEVPGPACCTDKGLRTGIFI